MGWDVKALTPPEPFGPDYNIDNMTLKKYRSKKRLTREERSAYGEAVEQAILKRQRAELRGALQPEYRSPSASGTWHADGEKISQAIREQQRNALLAYPSQARRRRTPGEWMDMYAKAMREKRRITDAT